MHDPQTVAFDIKRPWPQFTKPGLSCQLYGRLYWPTLITIWHVDPERDGTDDSCGWFMRPHHGDQKVREAIRKDFAFHWTWGGANQGWFDNVTDLPRRTSAAIALDMFYIAARVCFRGRLDRHGWRRGRRFVERHLFDILHFAESTTDGLDEMIHMAYGPVERAERIERFADLIYGCILRWSRPWYRHPKWHVWHWKIQIHPVQAFKRWAFSRCATCHQRFSYGYSPVSGSWSGTGPRWFRGEDGVYHSQCFGTPGAVGAVARGSANQHEPTPREKEK